MALSADERLMSAIRADMAADERYHLNSTSGLAELSARLETARAEMEGILALEQFEMMVIALLTTLMLWALFNVLFLNYYHCSFSPRVRDPVDVLLPFLHSLTTSLPLQPSCADLSFTFGATVFCWLPCVAAYLVDQSRQHRPPGIRQNEVDSLAWDDDAGRLEMFDNSSAPTRIETDGTADVPLDAEIDQGAGTEIDTAPPSAQASYIDTTLRPKGHRWGGRANFYSLSLYS